MSRNDGKNSEARRQQKEAASRMLGTALGDAAASRVKGTDKKRAARLEVEELYKGTQTHKILNSDEKSRVAVKQEEENAAKVERRDAATQTEQLNPAQPQPITQAIQTEQPMTRDIQTQTGNTSQQNSDLPLNMTPFLAMIIWSVTPQTLNMSTIILSFGCDQDHSHFWQGRTHVDRHVTRVAVGVSATTASFNRSTGHLFHVESSESTTTTEHSTEIRMPASD